MHCLVFFLYCELEQFNISKASSFLPFPQKEGDMLLLTGLRFSTIAPGHHVCKFIHIRSLITRTHGCIKKHVRCYRMRSNRTYNTHGVTTHHTTSQGFTQHYKPSHCITLHHKASHSITRPHIASQGFTQHHNASYHKASQGITQQRF